MSGGWGQNANKTAQSQNQTMHTAVIRLGTSSFSCTRSPLIHSGLSFLSRGPLTSFFKGFKRHVMAFISKWGCLSVQGTWLWCHHVVVRK